MTPEAGLYLSVYSVHPLLRLGEVGILEFWVLGEVKIFLISGGVVL